MALTAYLAQVKALLQNPGAPVGLYSDSDLTIWINEARGQVAGDGQCIRFYGSLAVTGASNAYNFSSISLSGGTGIQGVLNVRMATCRVTGGKAAMAAYAWEYLNQYYLTQVSAATGTPARWAQYAQGVNGSIYIDPVPSGAFTLDLDTICYPIDLVSDATAEAIPWPWTTAIKYYAAYLALLSAQNAQRQSDANRMFERYTEFMQRARRYSTPTLLPNQQLQPVPVPMVPPAGIGGGGA